MTAAEVRRAAREIDDDVLRDAAQALAQDDAAAAKRALAEGTTLNAAEIESLVKGISSRVQARVTELRQRIGGGSGL